METNTWDLPDVSYVRLEVHSLNMSCEILLGCFDQTFLAETRTASLSSLMMLRESCKSFQNDRVFSEHRIHLHRLVYHGLSILFLLK